ncbi:MAG: hypothetical protein WDA75_18940 [Candidatus Latescibacterota bacterium]|jgi:hypothetical protein
MPLSCGTAVRDITPTFPAHLHGYADRDRPSEGVAEPISLGCLALDDGERRALLVTADLIGIQVQVADQLRDLLAQETGIPRQFVFLACSHTHFAPALHREISAAPALGVMEPDPRFVEDFGAKVLEAARESLRRLRPAELETARVQVPQVVFNRRTRRPDGAVVTNYRYPLDATGLTFSPVDPELTALRLRNADGVQAVMANSGCHPVTGGQIPERDHYRVSADYPYYLRQTIAGQWACPVFFTLGAAGDAVPIDRFGDCRQRIGTSLGHAITLAERVFVAEPGPVLRTDAISLEAETILKVDPATARAAYEKARTALLALQRATGTDRQSPEYITAVAAHGQAQTAYGRACRYPANRHRIEVQLLGIGQTVLVGLPFEVLSEISLRLKARFPGVVVVSCCGGYEGYLPLHHEYARGGYEATPSSTHFAEGTADRILELVQERLTSW